MDKSGNNIPARVGKGTRSPRTPGQQPGNVNKTNLSTIRKGASGLDSKQPTGNVYGLEGSSGAGASPSQRYDPRSSGADPADFCYPKLRPTMVGKPGGVKPGRGGGPGGI